MKKFLVRVFSGLITAAAILTPLAGNVTVQAAQTGWVYDAKTKTHKYYDKSGKAYTGWHWMTSKEGQKTNHWSYFGADGVLRTGWQQMGTSKNPDKNNKKHWSYFGDNGWLRTGWQQMGAGTSNPDKNNKKHWSYFGDNGWLRTGWQQMGAGTSNPDKNNKKHWSYFGDNGWLRTGWQQMGAGTSNPDKNNKKHWSYFGDNGWLRTGWQQMGAGTSNPDKNNKKHWSYFGPNGWLRTGLQNMGKGTSNPDGNAAAHKSYFGDNGWLVTNKTFTYSGVSYKADDRGWLSVLNQAKGTVKYTVTFTDGNGKTLSTQSVSKGGAAVYPADPVRNGYRFLGWDKSFYNVTSNITVNAKWEKIPSLDEIRQKILAAVNKERKAAGKKELKLNSFINETAQEKAEDMCKAGVLDHYSDNLGYINNQFDEHGIRTVEYGENIAHTFSYYSDVAMSIWMNSEEHRENILDNDYTDLGVGYKDGYWVQQFAANPEKTEPAPKEETVYIECPHCHKTANKNYIPTKWKLKPDGYDITPLYSCVNCDGEFYICPDCDKDSLQITGKDAATGINTYRCKNCGYIPVSSLISKCSHCGKQIDSHMGSDVYTVHFQYSGVYSDFQEITVTLRYCPEAKKYNLIPKDYANLYDKYFEEMKKKYKNEKDIYKNITWVRTYYNGQEFNEKVITPQVKSLDELLNKSVLK